MSWALYLRHLKERLFSPRVLLTKHSPPLAINRPTVIKRPSAPFKINMGKHGEGFTSRNPLVWIDCEMTGLNIETDHIIQIACFVTDYDLNLLDPEGFETVVHQPKEVMDGMDDWCTKTHAKTGLTARVLDSNVKPEDAASALMHYVTKLIPQPGKAILAGSSVHYDKEFLRKDPYGKLLEHLHHRILDVSSIKEGARRWSPRDVWNTVPKKLALHEAKQDILESIEEARYYRDIFFREPKLPSSENKREDDAVSKE